MSTGPAGARVTRAALAVHPSVLGLPLAGPLRRLLALGLDFAIIGGLTAALSDATFFVWAVIGVLLLRVALKRSAAAAAASAPAPATPGAAATPAPPARPATALFLRLSVGCLGVLILSVVVIVFTVARMSEEERGEVLSDIIETAVDISPATIQGVGDSLALVRDASPEEALAALERAAGRLPDPPLDREARQAVLEAAVPDSAGWAPQADSLILLALDRSEAAARAAGVPVGAQLDTIAELEERVAELEEEVASRGRTFASLLTALWDQVGSLLGIWSLYFTVLLTLWKGQTIGKRLMGVRVVRLDGLPIGWWSAFERSGGYVAGVATGLLGFAQVLWDPNRQCIHDKIVGTVVVLAAHQPRMTT